MFYEVYLRSYHDSDGDGIGDLPGADLAARLHRSLNVDGCGCRRSYPSAAGRISATMSPDICGVDPMFGTMADLDRLIAEAHARELKLLDRRWCPATPPTSTTGSGQRARAATRTRGPDWYLPGPTSGPMAGPPNNWLSSSAARPWTWDPRRSQYYTTRSLQCQPRAQPAQSPNSLTRCWTCSGSGWIAASTGSALDCDQWPHLRPAVPVETPTQPERRPQTQPRRRREQPRSASSCTTSTATFRKPADPRGVRAAMRDREPERVIIGRTGGRRFHPHGGGGNTTKEGKRPARRLRFRPDQRGGLGAGRPRTSAGARGTFWARGR